MRSKKWLYGLISFIVIFSLWQLVSVLGWIDPFLLPSPSKIFSALIEWIKSGEFFIDFITSFWRGIAGLLIGCLIGIIAGLLTGRNKNIDLFVSPVLNVVRAFPPVSLIPVFITFFGIGDTSKILAIAFATIFPVWVNSHIGSKNIPIEYIRSGKILTKSKLKMFTKIILPASLSSIIAGTRISISVAFVMLYVSELAGASHGLGYQISSAHLSYRMDRMFASLITLGLIAALVDWAYVKGMGLLFPWMNLKIK